MFILVQVGKARYRVNVSDRKVRNQLFAREIVLHSSSDLAPHGPIEMCKVPERHATKHHERNSVRNAYLLGVLLVLTDHVAHELVARAISVFTTSECARKDCKKGHSVGRTRSSKRRDVVKTLTSQETQAGFTG